MIAAIELHADEMQRLCVRYHVQRLDLFGSASTGGPVAGRSDLDFVVEFKPEALARYADAYFGLLEALQTVFDCPVDLVVQSAIKNPYFLESVEATKTPVYEARGQRVPARHRTGSNADRGFRGWQGS